MASVALARASAVAHNNFVVASARSSKRNAANAGDRNVARSERIDGSGRASRVFDDDDNADNAFVTDGSPGASTRPSNSTAMSSALAKRRAGSFARHFSTRRRNQRGKSAR